eukprot:gnl/TRDRNA2_/TRDRNA2_126661_c2_seq1.p2 gnl/TRDRNA2_/TRDRNA2_126661_c2~~gnl/TRDRNA2_/TRDRNA2_126661_c2_seq1.p2  ORF type:complete len:139 (+),score=36.66 gnl/TRDRNA2_/TRDRNA2_126661_c2_seq1:2-418(+)
MKALSEQMGIRLDAGALKALARLPPNRAKDLMDEVRLGGKRRQGISNPSKYVMGMVNKMDVRLGVEQGLAMELAVSVGVVLNNEALDELASIPRKESHAIIREIAGDEEKRSDPMALIKSEVLKIRMQMDARSWPARS